MKNKEVPEAIVGVLIAAEGRWLTPNQIASQLHPENPTRHGSLYRHLRILVMDEIVEIDTIVPAAIGSSFDSGLWGYRIPVGLEEL